VSGDHRPELDPLGGLLTARPVATTPVARRPLASYDTAAGINTAGIEPAGGIDRSAR
jgi:hypothetical protein